MAPTLEQRLREVEDRLEIYNLIASHPPSADTGSGDYTRTVWTEDGTFRPRFLPQFPRPTGRDQIAAGSSNPEHHKALEQGIAHVSGHPYVRVTGDTAFAISYLQILVPDRVGPVFDVPNHGSSGGFHIHRISASNSPGVSSAPPMAGRSKAAPSAPSTAHRRPGRSLRGALVP